MTIGLAVGAFYGAALYAIANKIWGQAVQRTFCMEAR